MKEKQTKVDIKKVDTKEFDLPETIFIRDIENRVFQGIVLECLSHVEGISLVEGNFIDSILGRGVAEGTKGIVAEQDNKNHSVSIKVEVNICYGISIPEKAEEIQSTIAEEVTKLTGLHVSFVHVVFKNIIPLEQSKRLAAQTAAALGTPIILGSNPEEDYNDEF
jgi:uncharacterized alkaline shock family protein YloU